MADDKETKDESFYSQLPQSNIQNRTIDFIFRTANKICQKEDPISDHTHETGSMRATRLAVSMVLKYMPDEIKDKIRTLYEELDIRIKNINESKMDDSNKKVNKMATQDEICIEILTLCIITLTYSSISTELKEIEIIGKYDKLIEKTRNEKPPTLFITEETEEE